MVIDRSIDYICGRFNGLNKPGGAGSRHLFVATNPNPKYEISHGSIAEAESEKQRNRKRKEKKHCVEAMGKKNENQKTGLGRALVKQHNQMIQQSKDKSRFYKKKVLESFTEVSDIDAVIEQSLESLPEHAVASTTIISL